MKCNGCDFEGGIDLFCPACDEPCPDPEIERELDDYCLAVDIMLGAYSEEELAWIKKRALVENVQILHKER